MENIDDLPTLIKNNSTLDGLSVTIPHKESVLRFLDEVDETAKEVGAVNCIMVKKKLTGYNTDVFGFEKSLVPLLKVHHTKALILGTGGAAKAVAYVLKKLKIEFLFVTRITNHKSQYISLLYPDINEQIIRDYTLIINTTPVGMFPSTNECPDIPYHFLTDKHLLYDLIYNPGETIFLKRGKEKGAQTKNGLEMLELQAEKAWEIWNG